MREFKSLNDLIWWLQNNGGGRVEVLVSDDVSGDAVTVAVTTSANKAFGQGKFLKSALDNLKAEGA